MLNTVIRKEHKNKWERRTPLTPKDAKQLAETGLPLTVEKSEIRIYGDEAYKAEGLPLVDSPHEAQFVVGIKEPPVDSIQHGQVHLCFSHTIKGQDYNMPLLQKFLDEQATLFDYELITDENGVRTIAFGRYAGIAGAVDTFWATGQRLALTGERSWVNDIQQTWKYGDIAHLRKALNEINVQSGRPLRILIVGTGKVGRGAEEVCQWLGLPRVETEKFLANELPDGSFYAVVSSRHIHRRKDGGPFDFQDFVKRGKEGYESIFHELLGRFDILLQTPYWSPEYPKHLPVEVMAENAERMPIAIGDISCDINGSLECTQRATDIDNPVYTYFPEDNHIASGVRVGGTVVMAIDNLPCELSKDASDHFSSILPKYLPEIAAIDLARSFEDVNLSDTLKRACIVYRGELTPRFQYLKDFLPA